MKGPGLIATKKLIIQILQDINVESNSDHSYVVHIIIFFFLLRCTLDDSYLAARCL